ncbi:hypothetical protein Cgig2_024794 [Carnegiea gigantea]|uniref:YEATS domain-containing protein n=1 Tax=Carnegiea gigantea TaxID=171969 RepID=A0A9Q1QBY4_9CARY|nr:hypothetical protein Cgig2_024794 [Carnegiea gigantea]
MLNDTMLSYQLLHCYRESNQVADTLANIGVTQVGNLILYDSPPPSMHNILGEDFIGVAWPRFQSHKLTVYIRGATNEDLGIMIKRPAFQLHSSFNTPTRVIESPPFKLSEAGSGEFEVVIPLSFQSDNHPAINVARPPAGLNLPSPVILINAVEVDNSTCSQGYGEDNPGYQSVGVSQSFAP